MEYVVKEQFKNLLPPLTDEQYGLLEEDILKNGCISPIVIWNGIIIDGHNRYSICQKHDIGFRHTEMKFENENEAMLWAWTTQKARRNLTQYELATIALRFKPYFEEKAKQNQLSGLKQNAVSATLPKRGEDIKPINTRSELAQIAGISERTMGKVMAINEKAPEVIKEELNNNNLSINSAFDMTKKVINLPKEQQGKKAYELIKDKKAEVETREQAAERVGKAFDNAISAPLKISVNEETLELWRESPSFVLPDFIDSTIGKLKIGIKTFEQMLEYVEDMKKIKIVRGGR